MRFSRRTQIGVATALVAALFASAVVAKVRLSWRPVSVDLRGVSGFSPPQYLPIVWRKTEVWLMANQGGTPISGSGAGAPFNWRVVHNWNRAPLDLMIASPGAKGVTALGPSLYARAVETSKIEIWHGTKCLVISENPRRNSYGMTREGSPKLFEFSPDGTRLVATSEFFAPRDLAETKAGFCRYGATLFETGSGKQIARQSAIEGGFTAFAWSPNSREVAGITADGWVFILNGKNGKLRLKFRAHQLFGAQIAWSPDGQSVVTATNPRLSHSPTGLCFDFKSGEGVGMNSSGVRVTAGSGRSKRVIDSDSKGDTTWNGRTERLSKRFDALTGKPVGAPLPLQTGAVDLAFSPDGRQLALGEHEFALILNAQTLATERRLDTPPAPAPASSSSSVPAPVCVAWSGDGATLATSTERGLMLWRVR